MSCAQPFLRAVVAVLAVVILALGCRAKNPAAPGGTLTGTWSGAVVDPVSGTGTMTLTMIQTGAGVGGTWSTSLESNPSMKGGSAGGSTAGSLASLFLTPTTSIVCESGMTLSGTLNVTATLAGNRLTGTYLVLTCNSATSGTIDLTRQG